MTWQHQTVALPEDEPVAQIKKWFADLGFDLVTHTEPPVRPDPQTVSMAERSAPEFSHWCALRPGPRWYGGGWSEEEAIRSARKRWRVEQEGVETRRRKLP